jgi:hypothetical protein
MKNFPGENHGREIRKCNKPMKKHTVPILMAAGTLFAGCNTINSKSLAANAIGCPEEDIKVANEIASAEHLQHWLATCKGVKYVCCPEEDIKVANEIASAEHLQHWLATCKGVKYVCNYHPNANVSCKEATDQVTEYEDQDD